MAKYAEFDSGWFGICAMPHTPRFFKCQPWISVTDDLMKMIQFKPDVEIFPVKFGGRYSEFPPATIGSATSTEIDVARKSNEEKNGHQETV